MLICRVAEEGAGRGEPAEIAGNCQTANELFELMTKDHDFEAGDDPLTTSDLVLLYKNIDLGNQLMSNVRKRPNQHVENVYHGGPETDSELSESCSSEELLNIVFTNKERIDLFTNPSPLDSLCHKLGDLEMQVSKISNDLYGDRHLLNKDPYLREQLQSLQLMTRGSEFNTLLPTSLLDLICSKRLEDNYNFYLDNVITHVHHTIDQLKRISNGDYLPQKVKEKWRELDPKSIGNTSKVLTTSMSMPLQVKRMDRMTSMIPVWDDIVQNEIDLRALVKIMEKKIVLEIPRMISGSCNIFSRCRADKFVISCSRRRSSEEQRQEPRVDAVLTVRSTPAGQLISDIHSIMVLQPEHQRIETDCTKIMPLEYMNPEHADTLIPKDIELPETEQNIGDKNIVSPKSDECGSVCSLSDAADSKDGDSESKEDTDSLSSVSRPGSPERMEQILSTATRVVRAEAASNHATPNDLYFSISTLDRPTSLPEENTSNSLYIKIKKKSPERVRLKSPYENKSYILEERKRRKLLELKERRERRQIASNENSKVTKSRTYPQKVSSVTKLSITNKSFYNSIYGRNANGENAKRMSAATVNNTKVREGTQKIDEELDESEADAERDKVLSDSSPKIICTGNFLEDTETEMSYLKSKQDSDFLQTPTTTSVVSNDSTGNLYPQSTDYCTSHKSFSISRQDSTTPLEKQRLEHEVKILNVQDALKIDSTAYTSKVDDDKAPAVECRRSLEKICTLMKKLQRIEISETVKKKALASESRAFTSESGSSLKRRVSFSSPTIENNIKDESQKEIDEDPHTAAVPKVVISAKLPSAKADEKSRSKAKPRVKTIPENPLKAISQLLHKFDSVQKSRPKIADPKTINRSMLTENAELDVKIQKRRSRIESPVREEPKVSKVKARFVREEPEVKPQVLVEKINDLIDEAKEARGEAVRGPPRFSSRLNALAQPKRSYVQALAAEFPKRQIPARPQRPSLHHSRARADGRASPVSVKAPQSGLERTAKPRRSSAGIPKHHVQDSPQLDTLAAATADALHTLEKKVAVETPSRHRSAECAPLLPCDIQSSSESSFETEDAQSSSIGLELHRMVSAILRGERPPHATTDAERDPSPPPVATACVVQVEPTQTQNVTEEISVEKTAIEEIIIQETSEPVGKFERAKHDVTVVNSVTELEKLEHALHRSLSSGAFAGRLRVNKLTLSPRPSLQQVVMHQSGDTTLVLKSNLMQKIQITCQSSDQKIDLIGVLSRTGLNNGFSKFPLQISTVGYAFPVSDCQIKKITPRILNRDMFVTCDAETSCTIKEEHTSDTTVINDANGKIAYHRLSDDKFAIGEVSISDKNEETDISSDSTMTVSSDNKEATSSVNKENCPPSDYNTSFDILVGLLNEIQKITTCGSEVASSQTQKSVSSESSPGEGSANVPSRSWVTVSNSYMSSEAQLRSPIPEMNSVSAEAVELRPLCEDKEVLARVTPEYAAASTSQQAGLPIGIAASTYTDLPTSSCSVSAFTHSEHCDIGCNTLTQPDDKITEQMGIETNRTSVKSLVPYYNNIFKVCVKKDDILSPENSVVSGTTRNMAAVCNIRVNIAPVQKNKRILNLREEVVNDKKEVNKYCLNVGELDSTLKVKRDVLVTFYSILVLTVFAALAFPEMLQYA